MRHHILEERRAREGAGQSCNLSIDFGKPPRDAKLYRAVEHELRTRDIPLTANRVRALANTARTFMERGRRGPRAAAALAAVYLDVGKLPRWMR